MENYSGYVELSLLSFTAVNTLDSGPSPAPNHEVSGQFSRSSPIGGKEGFTGKRTSRYRPLYDGAVRRRQIESERIYAGVTDHYQTVFMAFSGFNIASMTTIASLSGRLTESIVLPPIDAATRPQLEDLLATISLWDEAAGLTVSSMCISDYNSMKASPGLLGWTLEASRRGKKPTSNWETGIRREASNPRTRLWTLIAQATRDSLAARPVDATHDAFHDRVLSGLGGEFDADVRVTMGDCHFRLRHRSSRCRHAGDCRMFLEALCLAPRAVENTRHGLHHVLLHTNAAFELVVSVRIHVLQREL